jgi:hypothetical protein
MKSLFLTLSIAIGIIAFVSCNSQNSTESIKKEKPFNEYLIGTWSIKNTEKFYVGDEELYHLTQFEMEFTGKKVYLTITWNIGGTSTGPIGPEALDYSIDGKRVIIENGNIYNGVQMFAKDGIYIFQSDSSLTTTPPMKNPILKYPDIKLYKK